MNGDRVPADDLGWRTAALTEPLATPVRAIRPAGGVRDRAVAILGAGTIGLLLLRVARVHGARRVVMTARSEANRTRAEAFGADARREDRRVPCGSLADVFDIPMTAPILGGATIGAAPESGVIDAYHRVFGCRGLHIVDGSAVPANLGVNPSLTITALAERAMSLWPNSWSPDLRPPLGAPYQRLSPIGPRSPAVPARAPAAPGR